MTADADWVAGVDGCPAGWLVVLRRLAVAAQCKALIVPRFADVLSLPEAPRVIAVDMPIGLPQRSGIGGRRCDIEARANLGQRQSSVFAVPSRAAVMQDDYRLACATAFATSDPPRKVSKQIYNLFSKIREIDVLLSPAVQVRVREAHPEMAFWALNGEQPLTEPKKVKSRPFETGLELRRRLLAHAGYDTGRLQTFSLPAGDAGPDDLLDAAACSWTAARIAVGEGRGFPHDPPIDARGLAMQIWC
jgi:predicted RNase H-like nuclease